ncbi:hypothetical protein OG562_20210 [Streptomyces sp. NBC_01275]|uniref:hypothetical protein n=1 Tax=Streptomyces sp. NBC_01275 TaxID=2903807 RepID=UPI00224C9A02|nr:hypothetical protein [Streptomyces sp. NBC_01275]MCX4763250.1 hypothetical protein [Streptomyces sp. NBC_01275]
MRAAALGETAEAKSATAKSEKAGVAQTEPAAAPVAAPVEITSETWKEHKGTAASIFVKGVEEPFAAQSITGWSIKFLQFNDADGKRQQIPVSTVERVTV